MMNDEKGWNSTDEAQRKENVEWIHRHRDLVYEYILYQLKLDYPHLFGKVRFYYTAKEKGDHMSKAKKAAPKKTVKKKTAKKVK
jgi:hypothetical protein